METLSKFEDEYPDEAAFMARVYATGGCFKSDRKVSGGLFPPRDVPRNANCPCGSGKKTKRCHVEWTSSIAGTNQ